MPPMPAAQEEAWHALMDVHDVISDHWALVGGQMVHLHCAERGADPARATHDADAVVDVRAQPGILMKFTSALRDLGFTAETSGSGVQHRWVREGAQIDVHIPEGVGQRAAARGGFHGAPSVSAPGTTQALQRSRDIAIEVGERAGVVRRPNLVGALVSKAAARTEIGVEASSGRHCSDFVVLCSLIASADFRQETLRRKDRQRLTRMVHICRSDPSALALAHMDEHLDRLVTAAGLEGR